MTHPDQLPTSPQTPREAIAKWFAQEDWPCAPKHEQDAWIAKHWRSYLSKADTVLALASLSAPVAWRYKCRDGSEVLMLKRLTDEQKQRGYYTGEDGEDEVDGDEAIVGPLHWAEETPLYASPFPQPEVGLVGDDDKMWKISALIADLQSVHGQFGDTCVYVRRGGLSWGAVALNRRSDDEKHGLFDLQKQHDRDMLERLAQIDRLKTDRDKWCQKVWDAEAKLAAIPPQPDTAPSPLSTGEAETLKQIAAFNITPSTGASVAMAMRRIAEEALSQPPATEQIRREVTALTDLLAAVKLFRGLVDEGGVPRYTITPGAALNSVIEEDIDPAIERPIRALAATEQARS